MPNSDGLVSFASELKQLEALKEGEFAGRHIGLREADIALMCEILGVADLDALIDHVVPSTIRSKTALDLPAATTEAETLDDLQTLAQRNEPSVSMIGLGYHDCITPPGIVRNILENPGWYTAYTPYQSEISQGRLEALLNFQHMVSDLTGLPLAGASLLDEATAAAEAMAMSRRLSKVKGQIYFVERDCHPQTLAVLRTRARAMGIQILVANLNDIDASDGVFGALLSYPASSGAILDLRAVTQRLHGRGVIVTAATDLLALMLLVPPGEWGADISIGSAQRFGLPMGLGGPHAAFLACREDYRRSMPGRLIGVSIDSAGRMALRMALQTREQHIRRDKATSNICTAQVLLAVIAGMYAVYHGPERLRNIAQRVHRLACILVRIAENAGVRCMHNQYFDTVRFHVPNKAQEIVAELAKKRYNVRLVDEDHIAVSLDEVSTRAHILDVVEILTGERPDIDLVDATVGSSIPPKLRRKSRILYHSVFQSYRTETELLRYIRRLQLKDIALDRSMIPLGSCTMKLNAAAEMIPLTLPGFAKPHPFAPVTQIEGYLELFRQLERQLREITGFDAISLQPNAGSQGEFAGLLTIRAYQNYIGEGHRNVCILPESAHGTNPASAALAGMKVITVPSDSHGDIDIDALKILAQTHRQDLSALMITYPSTHGVFEPGIKEVCEIIHQAGAQVYMDGANLNALVGLAKPAEIGADVTHINLHKTFCIPHGGGGPGMGPIGVKAHLAPFLPTHPNVAGVNPKAVEGAVGAVSAAAWGSASILTISYAYISMMGAKGLTQASKVAILSANYIAKRLRPHFPIAFEARDGSVAHECIIDLRQLKKEIGVTAEDVAKRLIDFGFHAPTMSWPVPETLMIEPTESEARTEIDRFCDAMIAIRHEIADIEHDRIGLADSPLRHAPHTADLLMSDWQLDYSRKQAFHPQDHSADTKYWPPVSRVDNVHGDRNLLCRWPEPGDVTVAAE